jgi:Uncharacterized protein conserved in bacteria
MNTSYNNNGPIREDRLEYQVEDAFRQLLRQVGFLQIDNIEHGSPEHGFDLIAAIKSGRDHYNIVIDTRNSGQPRHAKSAILGFQSWHLRKSISNGYFIFAAPFVSESSREICRDAGVGYLDLLGNCLIAFDHVYIERFGFQKEPEKRELRSVFSDKASRIVRRLLTYPHHKWHVQELAKQTSVSTGMVSQVKTKLLDSEYAHRAGDMFELTRSVELLQRWGEAYRFDKNVLFEYYSAKPLGEIERAIADACDKNAFDYAFTLFAGAKEIGSQYVRVANRTHVYIIGEPEQLAQEIGLKKVESGGNVIFINPFDEDLLFDKRLIDAAWIVSDLQLYLDFCAQKGRAQETADFLLDSRIRKTLENDIDALPDSQ